jgi:hypothetical protein
VYVKVYFSCGGGCLCQGLQRDMMEWVMHKVVTVDYSVSVECEGGTAVW